MGFWGFGIVMCAAYFTEHYKKEYVYIVVPTLALKNQYDDYKRDYIEAHLRVHVILPN